MNDTYLYRDSIETARRKIRFLFGAQVTKQILPVKCN